jgi:hypothetical protein
MSESREDALQAAMLAKFVGSQLGQIDSMSYDRNIQANRLDINQFISKVVSNNPQQNQQSAIPATPAGFAAPPPEDLIRQMVPEPTPRVFSEEKPQPIVSSDKVEKLLENIDKNLQLLISLIKNG